MNSDKRQNIAMGNRIPVDFKFSKPTMEMAKLIAKRKGITPHEYIQSFLDSPDFKKWLREEEDRLKSFKELSDEVDSLFAQIDKATERLHELGIEYWE